MTHAEAIYSIGVISDTHNRVAAQLHEIFRGVQLILHAGDIGSDEVIMELEMIAPVCAVSGNVDGAPNARRPLFRQLETPAGRIALTHGHLPQALSGNKESMVERFRSFHPDIIVFGHSHIPYLEEHEGVILFNPGSAGSARWGREPTVGLISVLEAGTTPRLEHIELK